MTRHLLLAATDVAAGELTQATRLARALIGAGDEVVFLLPRALDGWVAPLGAKRGWIDDVLPSLDRAVLATLARTPPDVLVLVDGASVAQAMTMRDLDFAGFVAKAARHTKVVSLDVWSLDETGLEVDYGADTFELPHVLCTLPRLIPVPFARPEIRGGYCALGVANPTSPNVRARTRAAMECGEHERVVVWPIASWQLPAMQLHPTRKRLADEVIHAAAAALATLPDVHVVQVGPLRHPALDVLGARLHPAGVVSATRYGELIDAADLMFGTNIAATSLSSAITAGVPALVGIADGPPGVGFRVCPIGLDRFLRPVLADNPYLDAIVTVEMRDHAAVVGAVERLTRDEHAIGDLRARQTDYAMRVRALPSVLDMYRRVTSP